ncbi:hypothetical protein HQ43_04365 [Porphyromonas canoris]|uniref:Ferrous iron transport protein B n=1 Tax=Porphyromonas canoris TaxID=36875 RepID=A0ABR4XLW6_9PORP|nr:nucleoside recognition domain-containing protein [Porphyromonas canoris]KGN92726.1 hypothetical protein HQ43_04365 [Porphyromonas canoris]
MKERELIIQTANKWKWEVGKDFHDKVSEAIYADAEDICNEAIKYEDNNKRRGFDAKLDKILASKRWGYPIMISLLAVVLWITIVGSNYPSQLLSSFLVGKLYPLLKGWTESFLPALLSGFLIDGVYLTTAWVVSVMLPPMAIFFPLFTLLEDFGYLPRVAFNMDGLFKRAGAHGKQALTMTMGFGCNAAAIVSTRIIDSPRERLLAIITNNFSLCNGRWPTQILLASIFIGPLVPARLSGTLSILSVLAVALLGIVFMFGSSFLLSKTLLKGEVSTFNLELPPYRPPRFWQTLYSSLVDRTLVVLGRAVVFAAPAGALIWLICNIEIGNVSLAAHVVDLFDEFGLFFGLNGVILLAYIVAIPANEVVIPTILMLTILTVPELSGLGDGAGILFEGENAGITENILRAGGWTPLTAICVMLFSLLHNPCSTTLYTIYKETKSIKWTTISALIPIAFGFILCGIVAGITRFFLS